MHVDVFVVALVCEQVAERRKSLALLILDDEKDEVRVPSNRGQRLRDTGPVVLFELRRERDRGHLAQRRGLLPEGIERLALESRRHVNEDRQRDDGQDGRHHEGEPRSKRKSREEPHVVSGCNSRRYCRVGQRDHPEQPLTRQPQTKRCVRRTMAALFLAFSAMAARGQVITGTVGDAANGPALRSMVVAAYSASGVLQTNTTTDAAGTTRSPYLSGQYRSCLRPRWNVRHRISRTTPHRSKNRR